ncbi:MAG: hypothetical protein MUE85_12245 [Microscillaceae bacterium]|nr:hypothetical protein [Microscillaceae bacterium]
MKKILTKTALILGLITLLIEATWAQLSKEEEAKLRKELKSLKIEQLKQLRNQQFDLDEQASTRNAQIVQKRADVNNAQKDLQKKDEGIEYLEEQLRKLKGQVGEVNATKQGRGNHECAFSVQIGAYKNRDLTQYMEKHPNFGVETDESGYKKYLMGYFTSYWEAKSLSKHLDKAGAQTYVVGFYKGKRIPDLKDMTQCTF